MKVFFKRLSLFGIVGVLAMSVLLSGCKTSSGGKDDTIKLSDAPVVEIVMKDGGKIKVELDPNVAPKTVENFIKLAKDGFYDGLTFHRVIKGFMIQGGDPKGDGSGGSEETITGEFSSNGVDNPISHKKGVISMARAGDPDSGSSQFFIVHEDSTFLDGQYAGFGKVVSGMDVVDKIADVQTNENDKPLKDVVIKQIKVIKQ
jgi:peptidyl-prolyl cis-trans isomerase B (cyclophilin B)